MVSPGSYATGTMPDCLVGIYTVEISLDRPMPTRARRKARIPVVGDTMTAQEMTQYGIRHKLRNAWGIMDEQEIKQTVAFASENWRLELIELAAFSHVADTTYRNRSMNAHPIVLRLDDDPPGEPRYDVLDGRFRIGMAKARGDRTILAWVGRI